LQLATLSLIACVLGSASAFAGDPEPCPYTVTEAGQPAVCGVPWSNKHLHPHALNDLGHWVGWRFRCPPQDDTRRMALRWTPETGVVALSEPPQTLETFAYGINNSGVIVGYRAGYTGGQLHGDWACVWFPDGRFVEIAPLGGSGRSYAFGVSNSNVVVGTRRASGTSVLWYAFIWQNGKIIDLDPTAYGLPSNASANARDVSDSGYAVGQFGDDSTGTGRAFRWKDGAVEILQPLPGAVTSDARAVTNNGDAVGNSQFMPGADFFYRAVIWGTDGIPVELPGLPGYGSWTCTAVNDAGVILGRMWRPDPGLPELDVVWLDGVPYAIRPLIDSPSATQFSQPAALNQLGQIVGRGPVPPVSGTGAWILTLTGSIADLDGDCEVNGSDLAIVLGAWGVVADAPATADINGDGMVDGSDLAIILGHWTG